MGKPRDKFGSNYPFFPNRLIYWNAKRLFIESISIITHLSLYPSVEFDFPKIRRSEQEMIA